MSLQPLLVDGRWVTPPEDTASFHASRPATGDCLPESYPVTPWKELDQILAAAAGAAHELAATPPKRLAEFLESYADSIEAHADELARIACDETGLPERPRLIEVEIPRTTQQLRDAAACARDQNWTHPIIDTANNLRSRFESLAKPVWVMGPNNFPFAYNGIAGGDFAAAFATGHAVIAKAHPAHPGTTLALTRLAHATAQANGLPAATVQLFYQCSPEDGLRLAGDPRLGAIGFTGGETAGRAIKAAADASGIPAYFEMSGINPVVLLPGAIAERASELADDFCQSSHQAVGQFCTNPGLLVAVTGDGLDAFINRTIDVFRNSIHGPMLTANLPAQLNDAVTELESSGAKVLARSEAADGDGYHAQAAWLQIDAAAFLTHPAFFQREVFGPASLLVVADSPEQQLAVVEQLNSSLTGSIYSSHRGIDDAHYQPIARSLAPKVGRLLNDKMPTGVTVSPAMVHGGPFPAGGHPGFTAVGMPSSLQRFAARRCYDNVRAHRMPATLRDRNPNPDLWRQVDGVWAKG